MFKTCQFTRNIANSYKYRIRDAAILLVWPSPNELSQVLRSLIQGEELPPGHLSINPSYRLHMTPTWQNTMPEEESEAEAALPTLTLRTLFCLQSFWLHLIFLLSESWCQIRKSQVVRLYQTSSLKSKQHDEIKGLLTVNSCWPGRITFSKYVILLFVSLCSSVRWVQSKNISYI